MSGRVAILIPAAGAARRMRGIDKLTEPVAGEPLLARQARRALEAGAKVLVTLPPGKHPRRDALADLPVTPVDVSDPTEGIAASLRAGVAALPDDCDGVMILLADMPDLERADLARMIADWQPGEILRATTAVGEPGHPVIFPRELFGDFATLTGDTGARDLLRLHSGRVRLLPLEGERALTDLDTPEAWAVWRARQADNQ